MQSIGETEILIEATIVGKVRVQKVSALAALQPRIGLVVGVDLNPIDGSLHSGKARPDEYWLTELRGNLYLSENGPSIGSVHWIGAHCEIRSQPYPSEYTAPAGVRSRPRDTRTTGDGARRERPRTVDRAMAAD